MTRRPADPYRIPPDPGYIGGYNWTAMLTGVGLLLLSNVAATQWIAYQFRYQPALGTAWVHTRYFALYSPICWSIWVWRYAGSSNLSVRHVVDSGILIIVVGCMVTLAMFFVLNMQRTKRLSRNAEDVHGSARWASERDIRQTGLLDANNGVYVGGWYNARRRRLQYLRHDGPEHILAFAPTRSGKGVGLVIPTLLTWAESAVVYDIKGENWAKTAGFRSEHGHLCFKFSPVEEVSSSRFNPLAELRLYTPRDVSDAQNIADMIVRTGEDSPQERYWQDAAASITTGMILHVCYEAAAEGRLASLADLGRLFTRPGMKFRETLNEILCYPHDPEHKHHWKTPNDDPTITHPVVSEKVQEMLDKEDKDFSGVLSTAKTALTLYSDPLVAKNTSTSDFTIRDLVDHPQPVSLYLVVPPSDKIRLRSLIRLIFTMIVNRLTEKMDFEGAQQRKNKHRLLFLIDEFPSLKRMELFADALSYMAGYGLKAYLITQDIRQVVDQYGAHESIVSNCHVRVAFAPNQLETAEVLSKMTGTKTVRKASFNFSGSRLSPIMAHVNASVDHIERPLMTPDEILRLCPARKEGHAESERIVAPGQMLVFVSGHYPILGTQMLYFADPNLAKRAEIPPPTRFFALENDQLIPQKTVDRTAHVISRPESTDECAIPVPKVETVMEHSFERHVEES
jgi:type IV secretion system protein VirD4